MTAGMQPLLSLRKDGGRYSFERGGDIDVIDVHAVAGYQPSSDAEPFVAPPDANARSSLFRRPSAAEEIAASVAQERLKFQLQQQSQQQLLQSVLQPAQPLQQRWPQASQASFVDGIDRSSEWNSPSMASRSVTPPLYELGETSGGTSMSSKVVDVVGEAGTTEAPVLLREKLLDTSANLQGYHRVVEDDRRKRKDLQQQHHREIMHAMAKLEKALSVEIKRRTESTASSQSSIDKALAIMLKRFQNRILERFDQLSSSIENLGERCATLERGIQQFRGELPSRLQVETQHLMRTIKEMTAQFDNERVTLETWDSHWLRQIQEAEYSVEHQIQQEQYKFNRCCETLQELNEGFASGDSSEDNKMRQAVVFEGVHSIRNQLAGEAKERETADDQVVEAINKYAATLQRNVQRAHQMC